MVATVEERLAQVEAKLSEIEERLDRANEPKIGMTIEEAKELLKGPAERGPKELEQFQRIIGCFEGPEDLSSRMREYLYGEREWS